MMRQFVSLTVVLAAILSATATAGEQSKPYLKASPQDVAEWRQLKFGLFIHWGPVSLVGTEIGWSRGGQRRGDGGVGSVPVEVYDNLYKRFNPVKFNAEEWVGIAKATGMRYMVFTTKHHDGFCMYDTKLTDYKITSSESPYGRDIVKQLADACRQGGLKWGIYYSQRDWYHPDYLTENHPAYITYLHGQMRELLTNYGRTDMIFFDGGPRRKVEDWDAENLIKMARQLQPHVVINNRAGLPADFDTPEQNVGEMQTDRPWETCMTLGTQWAWKPNDRIKSLKECIHVLAKVIGGDGNLLLNVGPMPDGRIEPHQAERLKQIGQWLKQYGQSIYGTRGGPFPRSPWGASTYKGNSIYLHVLSWRSDTLTLPPIQKRIVANSVLTGGTATVRQTEAAIEISVPKPHRRDIDTIVLLQLDGPAAEARPESADIGLYSTKATASSASGTLWQGVAIYAPDRAFDDDFETYWATDKGVRQAWLAVDLGKPTSFDRAVISEPGSQRVQQFELQCKDGNRWRTFAQGTKIGRRLELQFPPVAARHVRLNVSKAAEPPAIAEFQLFSTTE